MRLFLDFLINALNTLYLIRKNISKQNPICNKGKKSEFRDCLNENIPLGTNFEELKTFLVNHGFSKSELGKNNHFYFLWSANDLGNYKIGVIGHCNNDLEIIELRVI